MTTIFPSFRRYSGKLEAKQGEALNGVISREKRVTRRWNELKTTLKMACSNKQYLSCGNLLNLPPNLYRPVWCNACDFTGTGIGRVGEF